MTETPAPWIAGWNEPGFLPDILPSEFDTFEEAQAFIAEELTRGAESFDDEHQAEQSAWMLAALGAGAAQPDQPFEVMVDDTVYWVMRAER